MPGLSAIPEFFPYRNPAVPPGRIMKSTRSIADILSFHPVLLPGGTDVCRISGNMPVERNSLFVWPRNDPCRGKGAFRPRTGEPAFCGMYPLSREILFREKPLQKKRFFSGATAPV